MYCLGKVGGSCTHVVEMRSGTKNSNRSVKTRALRPNWRAVLGDVTAVGRVGGGWSMRGGGHDRILCARTQRQSDCVTGALLLASWIITCCSTSTVLLKCALPSLLSVQYVVHYSTVYKTSIYNITYTYYV